jgi:hypothetical protein
MVLYHLRQGLHVIASSWDYHRGAESRISVRGNSGRFSRAPSLVIMTDWFGPSSYGTTEPSGQHSFCAVSTFSCACFNMSFVQFQQLCVGLVLLFNIWFLLIQHCVPPSVSTFCLQSLNNSTVTGIWMASKVSLGPKISTKIHLDKTY